MIEHLYVHIPFCPKVCPYCSFYKEASDRNKTQAFLEAVVAELDHALEKHDVRPRTIFFGGGTPSALSTQQLTFLLSGLRNRLDLSSVTEWTLEMNPATVSLEKASLLRDMGINRISMGVQSWEPRLLEILGRVHTADQAKRSYEILRESGIDAVNLDLIYGIPGQTEAEWINSLKTTVALDPDHISAYCLTYEEDTEFFKRFVSGEYLPDDTRDEQFFRECVTILAGRGFEQYEISNYAKRGRECLHNIAYWEGKDYLGLGPSAFSTVGNSRWQNVMNTSAYTEGIQNGRSVHGFEEHLDPQTRKAERVAFSLRTRTGVAEEDVADKREEIVELTSRGLAVESAGHVRLTLDGRLLADEIASRLI